VRLVFRVDASSSIGTGHVMRCSAIIEEATTRGISCVVIGRLGGVRWLEDRLIGISALHYEHEESFQIADGEDILVIDSYEIPVTHEFIQPKNWKAVVSVSDDATPDYLASLVIHPGIDEFRNAENAFRVLKGAEFIPFRKSIKKSLRVKNSPLCKIVIFAGGIDNFGFALNLARYLKEISEFNEAVFFSNSQSEITSLDSRFVVRDFGPLLDVELENADLVFTTASTSSLEIIAREIPVGICFSVENQISYFEALIKEEVAFGIGNLNPAKNWELDMVAIERLITDSGLRDQLSANSSGFLDLLGSQRLVDEILKL
jgi:spore coat polysaccharide biosynthesis predicted glycosyltransferase SpsG